MKDKILEALKELRKISKKRNFDQACELIFSLKDINLKDSSQVFDDFLVLPHNIGKVKVCALVGPELEEDAKKVCDLTILESEFDELAKDKRKIRKIASEYDYFIAQANIMPRVAAVFGKYLGSRGKMPNPKYSGIIPPKGVSIKNVYERLQRTIRISNKKNKAIQTKIGMESFDDNVLAENGKAAFDGVIHHLPKEKNNLKKLSIKFTMSKPVQIKF